MDYHTKRSQYQKELIAIFGKNRVRVRIVNDDQELCFNSGEREILQTIRALHPHLEWEMEESSHSKALVVCITNFTKLPELHFEGFEPVYKRYFDERIKSIINKYDAAIFGTKEKKDLYDKAKKLYYDLNKNDLVDLDKYKEVRIMFDDVRRVK